MQSTLVCYIYNPQIVLWNKNPATSPILTALRRERSPVNALGCCTFLCVWAHSAHTSRKISFIQLSKYLSSLSSLCPAWSLTFHLYLFAFQAQMLVTEAECLLSSTPHWAKAELPGWGNDSYRETVTYEGPGTLSCIALSRLLFDTSVKSWYDVLTSIHRGMKTTTNQTTYYIWKVE